MKPSKLDPGFAVFRSSYGDVGNTLKRSPMGISKSRKVDFGAEPKYNFFDCSKLLADNWFPGGKFQLNVAKVEVHLAPKSTFPDFDIIIGLPF